MRIAEAAKRLGTESAFEVLVRARALEAQGRSVVHLEIGEPDFPTPTHVAEAGMRAIQDGHTHYGPAVGLPELRRAIAEQVERIQGVSVSPDQVVVTPGGKPIMFFTIMTLVEPGDEVIYPDPGFPIYRSMIDYVGGRPVPMPLREEHDFRLDVNELKQLISPRTKLIILNSPSNPVGSVFERSDLEAIADLVRGRDIAVLSDEIYARITYGYEHESIAALPGMLDQTIILDGFSKTYAMTGWRLGYGVFPAELVPVIDKLMVNSVSCTPAFSQYAGLAALTGPQDAVDRMLEEFDRRRQAVVRGLNAIPGLSCTIPRGAFYAFPNIAKTGLSSKEFADRLLQEAGVATLSGTSFGAQGEGYLRLSYASSLENLEIALKRIEEFVSSLGQGT
ncbi:MAG: pyridoxal phosphate-dependent aminotransferase [Chloroflexota bacterium]